MKAVRLTTKDIEEAATLFHLMAAVFEEESELLSADYVHRLLRNESSWTYAAMDEVRVVGGLTAHVLPMSNREAAELFVYDIAVIPEYQRQGVGRLLMTKVRQDAGEAGIDNMFVPADNEDIHALDFYAALGGEPSPVTIFTFECKA